MTSPDSADILFWARLEHIIKATLAALPDEELNRRAEWCRTTGQHGIRAQEADNKDGTAVRLVWGGATLALVERDVFTDSAYTEDLSFTLLPAAPDDAAEVAE